MPAEGNRDTETSASPQPPKPVPRALSWHLGCFSRWKCPSLGHQVHLAGLPLLANPKTCRMQDAQGEKNLIASRYPALQSCQEIWLWIQQHLEEILPCTSASKSNYLKMAAPSSRSRLPHPHHPGKADFRPLRTRAKQGVPRTPRCAIYSCTPPRSPQPSPQGSQCQQRCVVQNQNPIVTQSLPRLTRAGSHSGGFSQQTQ